LFASSLFGFHVFFQAEQVQGPEAPVLIEPSIQVAQRFRIELIDAVAAFPNFGDQLRGVQYAKVFGNGWAAHVEASRDLIHRLPAFAQAIENGTSRGVGDGVKNAAFLRNH
jgi:hypothetical protein